ncbi:abortive infection family protein [Lonepinella sp. BR2882]|uniref:abortive infection family protein n=1 Tax=Lonepinella sp. BR2882 TaxID=3095283 RepID=UPI003F6DAF64
MDELLIQVETLQNILISRATGGKEKDSEFIRLRHVLLDMDIAVKEFIPRFVRTCGNLNQFWQFIKKFDNYDERREYIKNEFHQLLEALKCKKIAPSDEFITKGLDKIDADHVQAEWSKALDRRSNDPEGAITLARTLIETVCKHILDDMNIQYDEAMDLPKLYKKTAEVLNLAPSQHTEEVFKQILGGCTAVIEGLGTLRNRLSDAHGKGKMGIKPAPRHAELAVNLSGALASYLLATWEARKEATT